MDSVPFLYQLRADECAMGMMLYRITQHPAPSPFSNVKRAARVAASKTSSTPSPDKLEHSRYLRAPTSLAAVSPSCSVTKRMLFLRISSMATGSSRRSFLRPTRMMGTPGHFSVASSIHYDFCPRFVSPHSSTSSPWLVPPSHTPSSNIRHQTQS